MSEQGEAKKDGAVLQPNSGRGKHRKGDATLGPFVIDYKEYAESYGVSRKTWAKISTDAWQVGGIPALKLVLGHEEPHPTRLWVIGDKMFHEMLEAWQEKYETSTSEG